MINSIGQAEWTALCVGLLSGYIHLFSDLDFSKRFRAGELTLERPQE